MPSKKKTAKRGRKRLYTPRSIVDRARDLIIYEEKNPCEASKIIRQETGFQIHHSTIRRWVTIRGWKEISEKLDELRDKTPVKTLEAYDKLLDDVAENVADTRRIELLLRMARMLGVTFTGENKTDIPISVKVRTPQEAVSELWKAVEKKLGMAAAEPHKISAEAIRDIGNCLTMMKNLEEKYPQPNDGEDISDGDRKKLVDEVHGLLGVELG